MPKLINCSRCGNITEELTINKKIIKNCKKCRDAHNNKYNKTKEEQEEDTPQEDTPQEDTQEQPIQEATQEETQEDTPQEEAPKPIKTMLKSIITNITALTEITQLQQETTTDILNNINIKLDNIINNISNTTTQTSEADINEFIKQQQLQNKIIINKLNNLINAIT